MSVKLAKQVLNEFYQKAKQTAPRYEVLEAKCDLPDPSRFICNLYLSAVSLEGLGFPDQIFQGEGRNKKEASNAAAEAALEFLSQQPVYVVTKSSNDTLEGTISKAFAPEFLGKDPEFLAHCHLSVSCLSGLVPLPVLSQCRRVKSWMKEVWPQRVNNAQAAALALKQELSHMEGEVKLTPDGQGVRISGESLPPLDLVNDSEPGPLNAVLVPADHRFPVVEVPLAQSPHYLSALSRPLRVDPEHLVMWGRVGHKVYYVAHPRNVDLSRQAASFSKDLEGDRQDQDRSSGGGSDVSGSGHWRGPQVPMPPATLTRLTSPRASMDMSAPRRTSKTPSMGGGRDEEKSGPLGGAIEAWGSGIPRGSSGGGSYSEIDGPQGLRLGLRRSSIMRDPSLRALSSHRLASWGSGMSMRLSSGGTEGSGSWTLGDCGGIARWGSGIPGRQSQPGVEAGVHVARIASSMGPSISEEMEPPAAMDWVAGEGRLQQPEGFSGHVGTGGHPLQENRGHLSPLGPSHEPSAPQEDQGTQPLLTDLECTPAEDLLFQPPSEAGVPPTLTLGELTTEQQVANTVKQTEPSMYSMMQAAEDSGTLNLRASWIAGQPVYGDVVLSTTRISQVSTGRCAVKWRSFGLEDYWRCVSCCFPESSYCRLVHAPLGSRLPKVYKSPGGWLGPSPRQLLSQLLSRYQWDCQEHWEEVVEDADVPGRKTVELTLSVLGIKPPIRVSEGPTDDVEVAEQQVALTALHQLSDALARALGPPRVMKGNDVDGQVLGVAHDIQVVNAGQPYSRRAEEGCLVKVTYRLFIPIPHNSPPLHGDNSAVEYEVPAWPFLLEARDHLTVELGSGGVLPAIEALVYALKTEGGLAQCRVSVPLEGSNPLGVFRSVDCALILELEEVSGPSIAGQGRPGPALFSPSLSQQRYQLVADMVKEMNAKVVVDVGCGEGRLLEYLVTHSAFTSLEQLVGLDVNGSALAAAGKRLEKLTRNYPSITLKGLTPDEDGTPDHSDVPCTAPPDTAIGTTTLAEANKPEDDLLTADTEKWAVDIHLHQASLACLTLTTEPAWGNLRGADLAAMIEVVEHLDPEPLLLVGPVVLGGLRPRVLVMTTPNWEYNKVLRSVELVDEGVQRWPGPPGRDGLPLRCNDHRFEWTREEFQSWCNHIAGAYGYQVDFVNIGHAIREEEVLASARWEGTKEVGAATQGAIFRLKGGGDRLPSSASRPLTRVWGPRTLQVGLGGFSAMETDQPGLRRSMSGASGEVSPSPPTKQRKSETGDNVWEEL